MYNQYNNDYYKIYIFVYSASKKLNNKKNENN